MKTIDYEDIKFIDSKPWVSGSFGSIRRCIFDGKSYICKTFNDSTFLKGKRKKLDLLSEIKNPRLYVPKFWVNKSGSTNRYLTGLDSGKDIDFISQETNEIKYKTLKNAKELILAMHSEGIIHSDLSLSNILSKNLTCSIIDFDNSSYKGFEANIKHTNDYCFEFIEKYGIKPELDIYMFNLLTYYLMNKEDSYFMIRNNIYLNKYGCFDNKDGIKICKSLFLDDKVPNKDFLIDTIDETSFTR